MLTLLVPDIHLPWADWPRIHEVARWAKVEKPDRIIFLGDVVDAYALSRFPKNPTILSPSLVRREREGVAKLWRLFSPCCKPSLIFWLRGNHEERWDKRIGEKAEIGWYSKAPFGSDGVIVGTTQFRYISSGAICHRNLFIHHGYRVRSVAGTGAASLVRDKSVVQGHSHALALMWHGPRLWSMETGYLAKESAPCFDYCQGLRAGLKNWRHGFGWIDRRGLPHIEAL